MKNMELLRAADSGDMRTLRAMLEGGADVDFRDPIVRCYCRSLAFLTAFKLSSVISEGIRPPVF